VVLAAEPNHLLALDHQCALMTKRGETKQAADMHRKVCGIDPHHTKKVSYAGPPCSERAVSRDSLDEFRMK
jgi:hypothetical protein